MKIAVLIVFWAIVLGIAVWWTFSGFDGSGMDIHGWIALGLGVVLSLALGIGLMMLVFYSQRHGYDDRVEIDTETDIED